MPGATLKISLAASAIEIGRGHGADAALAEAPRGRGIGFGDLLLHLHEGFERQLGAAETLRQQRAIKPVLDQRLRHRRRQPPRPFDLVGVAHDQGAARARARRGRGRDACSCASSHSLVSGSDGDPSAAVDQGGRLPGPSCRARPDRARVRGRWPTGSSAPPRRRQGRSRRSRHRAS